MAIRLTPLNITSSALLVTIGYTFLDAEQTTGYSLSIWLLFSLFFLSTCSDILFRGTIKDLKRIWLIELLFVVLIAALTLLLKRI
ncbi:hypothetical protein ADIARSV_2009 [Arcticibacter svalbardensis MN12-7]|uniref:Uncharacterized protein n=1 Tax=Arcticibacter svalbardensis MN12-7 TaxID=1150600 RepID=R9GSY3_9SPHI|nr:hypothetical protein [Arcticibacter svalbardensis]EOR94793.1 hypothetical protein ADIARSV_2009 [Arcticibacter svalbardensis MN12-7]